MYTREQIQSTVEAKGYKYFTDNNNKNYDVNIIGIRNSETKGRVTNAFDDILTIAYKEDGEWQYHEFQCTTDPGSAYMNNPIVESKGTAILKPGQYRGSHKLRLHAGKYLALGQQRNVKVYRDRNKDGKYDFDASTIDEGLFGINVHRATGKAGKTSSRINKWSAGCQVIASNDNWHCFLDICQTARDTWSNNFTYTLIDSTDINS